MIGFQAKSAAEYRLWMCNQWTEAQLQDKVIQLAQELGWLVYHTHDSRRSQKGWPDLVLLHPVRRQFIIWELKSEKGTTTKDQKIWLAALAAAGITVGIRRPADWASESIQCELNGQSASIDEGTTSE